MWIPCESLTSSSSPDYVYAMEYIWQLLEPNPDALMTSIIDLTGLSFSVIRKRELVMFIQKFCSTMDSHFPQRAHRTLLINSPKASVFNLL